MKFIKEENMGEQKAYVFLYDKNIKLEFDDKPLNSLEDCQQELEELREHNLLLIDRYVTFKNIIRSSGVINESAKIKYPNLYYMFYEEDLARERTKLQEPSLDELDRFKETYN